MDGAAFGGHTSTKRKRVCLDVTYTRLRVVLVFSSIHALVRVRIHSGMSAQATTHISRSMLIGSIEVP